MMTADLVAPVDLELGTIPATVLVVGGTGMLAPAVTALLDAGRTVVLVARHASRFSAPRSGAGRLVSVDADWQDAADLAARVGAVETPEPIGAALLWVHLPHRDPVTRELDRVLPAGAEMVRLWGTGSGDARADAAAGAHPAHRVIHEALLGSTRESGARRWLTHDEISSGSLQALASRPGELVIGELAS